jgi:hypothetical protein
MRTTSPARILLAGLVTAGVVLAGGSPSLAAASEVAPDPDAGLGTATVQYDRPIPAGSGVVTPMATAPNCIDLGVEYGSVGTNMWATVVNRCGSNQRINIIVSGAPDSGCFTLRNGYQQRWTFTGANPRVTRIDAC